jgi:hypothetical protein
MASVCGVIGNVKKRLVGYQQSIVQPILDGFDGRIQSNPLAIQLRETFDFRRMPLQLNAEANQKLLTWSDDVVENFLPDYFLELDKVKSTQVNILPKAKSALSVHQAGV